MSKTIKVDDQVYVELDQLRGKGETFGQAIAKLIALRLTLYEIINTLEGAAHYHEWREQELKKLQAEIARRDSQAVSPL